MTEALQVHQGAAALSTTGRWTPEQVALVRATVARGASDAEFKLFVAICGRTGLDPFTKQIHFVKYGDSPGTTVTGIDGYRLIAQRSGEYQGQTAPEWCGSDGEWVGVWLKAEPPAAARVGVWRAGFREPAWGVARMTAYRASGPMWSKMGAEMLAKCAEALALRKAFPNELSGLYTKEEMQQAAKDGGVAEAVADSEPADMPPAERDWHEAFVDLCRDNGFAGPGKKLVAANLVRAAMGDTDAFGASPPKNADWWREAVEWVEAHGWPGAPDSAAPAPEPDTYFSASVGKRIPIRTMPTPHLEAAIAKLVEAGGDPENGADVLRALKAEVARRRSVAVDEAVDRLERSGAKR